MLSELLALKVKMSRARCAFGKTFIFLNERIKKRESSGSTQAVPAGSRTRAEPRFYLSASLYKGEGGVGLLSVRLFIFGFKEADKVFPAGAAQTSHS